MPVAVPVACSRDVSARGFRPHAGEPGLSLHLLIVYGVTQRNNHCLWLKKPFFFFFLTEPEQNWEAVVGSQKETEKKHFFINICHRLLPGGKARGCPEDAAVCSVGEWCQSGRRARSPEAAPRGESVREAPCGLAACTLCAAQKGRQRTHEGLNRRRLRGAVWDGEPGGS